MLKPGFDESMLSSFAQMVGPPQGYPSKTVTRRMSRPPPLLWDKVLVRDRVRLRLGANKATGRRFLLAAFHLLIPGGVMVFHCRLTQPYAIRLVLGTRPVDADTRITLLQ